MPIIQPRKEDLKVTHENIVPENGLLDFEAFRKEAAKKMKAGQPLTGESGILTPLLKSIVETSLDAEIEQHMEAAMTNRRNGKLSKLAAGQ